MMGCLGLILRMCLFFICDILEGLIRVWVSIICFMLDDYFVLEVIIIVGVFVNCVLICIWLLYIYYNVIEVVNNDRKFIIVRK